MSCCADGYAFVSLAVKFVVFLKRKHEYTVRQVGCFDVARRDIAYRLLLLLQDLGVGFVYREVELRRYQVVAPGFADLKVVVEGVVVARKQVHRESGQCSIGCQDKDEFQRFGHIAFHL